VQLACNGSAVASGYVDSRRSVTHASFHSDTRIQREREREREREGEGGREGGRESARPRATIVALTSREGRKTRRVENLPFTYNGLKGAGGGGGGEMLDRPTGVGTGTSGQRAVILQRACQVRVT